MITTIKKSEIPELFVNIFDQIIEYSLNQHRNQSSFIKKGIIEYSEVDKKFFPDINNLEDYYGYWETNSFLWDDSWGADWDAINELTRVEKVEIKSYEWKPVKI